MLERTYTESNLSEIAEVISDVLKPGKPFFLFGEMGAGKTTLAKQIIKTLGCDDEVTSPTFNIMQSYSTMLGTLWHVDLYRLKHIKEIEELGIFEMFKQHFFIVEWPEKLENYLPSPHLKAFIEIVNDTTRTIKLEEKHE